MGYNLMQPRFHLGAVYATSGAVELGEDLTPYIHRHHCGDWGDLDDEDKQTNEDALTAGSRILSCYVTESGERLYVITEWDRRTVSNSGSGSAQPRGRYDTGESWYKARSPSCMP